MSIKKVICITGAIVIFVLSIKSFYFDTNLGYTMEASPFSTTGCPLYNNSKLSFEVHYESS